MRSPRRTLLAVFAVLALTGGSGAAVAATHGKAATHKSRSATHKARSTAPKSRSATKGSCPHMSSSGSSSSSSSYRPGSSA